MIARRLYSLVFTFLVLFPVLVHAALPAVSPSVRYMSLGDSLAAGYKAQPATKGFAYQLYLNEVFGRTPDTAFDNAAVRKKKGSGLYFIAVADLPRRSVEKRTLFAVGSLREAAPDQL